MRSCPSLTRAMILLLLLVSVRAAPTMTLLSASDDRIRYEGRLDRTDPVQPVLVWAGTRIALDFEGEKLAVVFGPAVGQNFFNVSIDGATEMADGSAGRFEWPRALAPGRHRLEIFKRSEAEAGQVAFRGVELAPGAQAWAPAPPSYRLKMEFLGDSITVGANNEDGAVDQWEDRRTHNHALSYGYLTSQALGADHRAMAVSGMGLCEGYVEMKAGEVWDKVYPRAQSVRADLAGWVPDVVCVNLGENDDAFTRMEGRPFPPAFVEKYVALVRSVRAAYPSARIVLLRGGMWGGARSPDLKAAWAAAVKELEASDPAISHYAFAHWSQRHPRVSDHRIMADELVRWLKAQAWMGGFLGSAGR